MSWASAIRKPIATPVKVVKSTSPRAAAKTPVAQAVEFVLHIVDWDRLVSLDFETYYDADYTLSKLSTSEYVRDERFEASMVGIKIGRKKTKVVPHNKIKEELAKINWKTHSVLCHNVQFDGFILSHQYGVYPKRYYCSLSMARGLHSNEIGAGLNDVSVFYGGQGKTDGLESMKGKRFKELWANKPLWKDSVTYCANDVDEMFRVFCEMQAKYPAPEMELIHMTARMFCAPVLKINIPRVQAEYEREVKRREDIFLSLMDTSLYYEDKAVLKTGAERALRGKERDMLIVKRIVGSNEKFKVLLLNAGLPEDAVPLKVSPAYIKKSPAEKAMVMEEDKWVYAFARDDLDFVNMPDKVFEILPELDPENPEDVATAAKFSESWRTLVDARIAVKSTTNITRAQRFLEAGKNGMKLPVGYAYYRAHTGRWGGNNKMNMQNLTRGGELRLSIEADKGHQIAVVDSGQIEARVNGWLWDQTDLLDAFRVADTWDKKKGVARGVNRDAYCRFGDGVYAREITTDDKMERFVGKVCVLGLGYQMGASKFQMTLAKGALGGPPVFFSLQECHRIVNLYRRQNHKIAEGWKTCAGWIEHMADPDALPIVYKCLEIGHEYIRLPNGMCLKYPDLKKARGEKGWDEWSYQSGDMRKKIYGGLLTENLVQALARIIVAEQMLMIDKKYPVVMTTHDECVTHPKTAVAQKCYEFMHKCMITPLPWCPDIPLNAEGGFDFNYSK